jgi:tripartite-type tricarboxylate transporter receptor subunit TctC
MHYRSKWFFAAAGYIVCALLVPAQVLAQTPYYAGKTITIVRGGGPGGSGDFQARALMPFLTKHIPGNPHVVMEMMPGAAGRRAANHMFNTAKPDGLTISSAGGAVIPGPIIGLPGVKFDIDKFIYLGSTETGYPYVFYTRKEAGLDKLEKLRRASELRVGAHSVGHSLYVTARLFAYVFQLKDPSFVVGFTNPELNMAMERGEVDARTTSNIDDLFRDGLVEKNHFHAQIMNPKGRSDPRLPGLPDLLEFTKDKKVAHVVDLFRAFQYPRWPIHLPPGTPKEQVQILREALNKTWKDPEFKQTFKKLMGREPTPISGEEVERSVKELPRDPEVVALYKKLADAGPLPAY